MKNEHKRKREKQKTLWTIAFWKTKEKINNNNQRNIRLFARDIIFLFVFALMSNRQCLYVYQVFLTIIILWFFSRLLMCPACFFFILLLLSVFGRCLPILWLLVVVVIVYFVKHTWPDEKQILLSELSHRFFFFLFSHSSK